MSRRGTVFAVLIAVLVLTLAPAASAGKGPPGRGGSIGTYDITLSAGPYTFGQTVSATTNVPMTMNPFIWMKCYQNGIVVGTSDHAAFPGGWYYNWPFSLGPTASWTGGAADCTFTVVHTSGKKVTTDARLSIRVNA